MLTLSRISSIDIRITMTFFRFRKMPKIPMTNTTAATVRKCSSPTILVPPGLPALVHSKREIAPPWGQRP